MAKEIGRYQTGSIAPAGSVISVTASDDDDLPNGTCRALLVGTAGAATIIDGSGTQRADVPLQQGYNPIHVQRVLSSNLSASDIWALY